MLPGTLSLATALDLTPRRRISGQRSSPALRAPHKASRAPHRSAPLSTRPRSIRCRHDPHRCPLLTRRRWPGCSCCPTFPPLQPLSPEDGTKVSPPLYFIFYLYLVFVSSSGLMVLAHEFKSISMQMYSVGCA
jgi:hypothetical protein